MEENMSALNTLKFVSAKKPTQLAPIEIRRRKLSSKLWSQIQLANALNNGDSYTEKKFRTLKDRQTGESRSVEVMKRIRQMWFVSENGKVCVQIKYGSKILEFSKGKNAIEVSSGEELIAALNTLKIAVESGELDSQLNLAADSVKEKFKK
jgi:hypothetical protein